MKNVIATRVLEVVDVDGRPCGKVTISIGRPVQEPEGEWRCPYKIVGLGFRRTRAAFGFDAIQAIQGAFLVIGGTLAGTKEAEEGHLLFDGSTNLGFPLPRERST
jgi:hypothetical protein